jgi:hypothetical protein
MSSLASGGVSLIFHIDERDADSALRLPQRPGMAVQLSVKDG